MLSEHRDLAAAKAFFRSAKTVTGVTPDRVTPTTMTDGWMPAERHRRSEWQLPSRACYRAAIPIRPVSVGRRVFYRTTLGSCSLAPVIANKFG